MLRVTCDTNVIISGLNFNGNPRRILEMAEDGQIQLCISDDILDETARVLRRPKFGWPEEQIREAIDQLSRFGEHVEPKKRIDVVKDDPTDNRIVECALASASDYLVSGDAHLLELGKYGGVKIVSPANFVSVMTEHGKRR